MYLLIVFSWPVFKHVPMVCFGFPAKVIFSKAKKECACMFAPYVVFVSAIKNLSC